MHARGRRRHAYGTQQLRYIFIPASVHVCLAASHECRLACIHELVAAMGYDPQGGNKQRSFPRCPPTPTQEVVAATTAVGYDPEEVDALFYEADTNRDSVISFEEFIQLMRHSYIT